MADITEMMCANVTRADMAASGEWHVGRVLRVGCVTAFLARDSTCRRLVAHGEAWAHVPAIPNL